MINLKRLIALFGIVFTLVFIYVYHTHVLAMVKFPHKREIRLFPKSMDEKIHVIAPVAASNGAVTIAWEKIDKGRLLPPERGFPDGRPVITVIAGRWSEANNDLKISEFDDEMLNGLHHYINSSGNFIFYHKRSDVLEEPWNMTIFDIHQKKIINSFPPMGENLRNYHKKNFYFEDQEGDVFLITIAQYSHPSPGESICIVQKYNVRKNLVEDVGRVFIPCGFGIPEDVHPIGDEHKIAIFGIAFALYIVDLDTMEIATEIPHPHKMSLIYGGITKDGKIAYAGGSTCDIGKYDVIGKRLLQKVYASPTGRDLYGYRPTAIRLSPDEQWLAVGTGPMGDTYLFQTKDMSLKKVLKHYTTVSALFFSPDSSHIAVEASGVVRIWAVAGGGSL